MTTWEHSLIEEISHRLSNQDYWRGYLPFDSCQRAVHLAVFIEPFLQFVLEGKKSVESRFSINQSPPYKSVKAGDVVLVKRSGGPVVAVAEVGNVWFYKLDKQVLQAIRAKFGSSLCIEDPAFWKSKSKSCYATLMQFGHVQPVTPVTCFKRDRRGWMTVMRDCTSIAGRQLPLDLCGGQHCAIDTRGCDTRGCKEAF